MSSYFYISNSRNQLDTDDSEQSNCFTGRIHLPIIAPGGPPGGGGLVATAPAAAPYVLARSWWRRWASPCTAMRGTVARLCRRVPSMLVFAAEFWKMSWDSKSRVPRQRRYFLRSCSCAVHNSLFHVAAPAWASVWIILASIPSKLLFHPDTSQSHLV